MIITKHFEDLSEYSICHPMLLELLYYVDKWLHSITINKHAIVTEIWRSTKEQAIYYPDNPQKKSLHMTMPVRAIDLRTSHLDKKNIHNIITAINIYWRFAKSGNITCCKYHKIANGVYHFHIRVSDETKFLGTKTVL